VGKKWFPHGFQRWWFKVARVNLNYTLRGINSSV
jgi:hypothetical protein